jgi:hypothetical protein
MRYSLVNPLLLIKLTKRFANGEVQILSILNAIYYE